MLRSAFATICAAALLCCCFGCSGSASDSEQSTATESWGPQDRTTYTWESRASQRTFDSITDNPGIGNECNFVRVRQLDTGDTYVDEVTVQDGCYYEVYVYYHNNADPSLNESGEGIANNVRLSIEIPANIEAGKAAVIKGTITASNTEPESVWDCAYLTFEQAGSIKYVENSAVIHNGGSADGKLIDGTALLGDGVRLAYWDDEWGIIPGGNDYAGYVTFELYVELD